MTINNCVFEFDQLRGVLYVHSNSGITVLRICGLPRITESNVQTDITLKFMSERVPVQYTEIPNFMLDEVSQ